jgi:hypothetical protein
VSKAGINKNRALLAAAGAGTAYLGAMWLDSELSSHPFNDLKLVGQPFTTRSPQWIIQGLVAHYGMSAIMALAYASWAGRWLPGPGWFKGLLFLQLENTILYPGAAIIDPFHAGVRSGQLPSLLNWKTFKGQVVRHLAFGLALGLLYPTGK